MVDVLIIIAAALLWFLLCVLFIWIVLYTIRLVDSMDPVASAKEIADRLAGR